MSWLLQVALSIICDVTKEKDIQNLVDKTKELLERNHWKLWGGLFLILAAHLTSSTQSLTMPGLEMEEELTGFQPPLSTKLWMSIFMEL